MDRLKDKPTHKNKKTARKPLKKPLAGIKHLERIMGVEPTTSAWEANVLPINYIRVTDILYHNQWDLSSEERWKKQRSFGVIRQAVFPV